MTASTITSSTVLLANGSTAVSSAVSYSGGSLTATLTPSSPLANGTTYTATIRGGASGVKDAAGNALASDYSWTFTTVTDTTPPSITSVSPVNGATSVAATTTVTASFSERMMSSTITTSSFVLRTNGNAVTATVNYDAASLKATLTPTAPLTAGGSYTATVTGGTAGVKDEAGNPLASDFTWSFTVSSGGCPCSLWTTTTPVGPIDSEVASLELGLKFRADVDGYITGIRFFKYSQNSGTHLGDVWTSSGTLLGTVTFSNETASGWQEATFANPIPVKANTTYIASYHTNTGRYAATEYGFSTAVDTPPLHALASAASGGNGVFAGGTTNVFPNQTWHDTNYWVDVVFNTTTGPDTTPPNVTGTTPTAGATNVPTNTLVTASFNEAMTASTINPSTMTLRAGATSVSASVSYNPTTRTATLMASALLNPGVQYTATVVGGANGVQDAAGNSLASNYAWTFTTGNPGATGSWSDILSFPIVAINATLLRTGNVLIWDGGTSTGDPPTHGGLSANLWNPTSGAFTAVPTSRTDLFCSSSCALSDGRIFVAGGSDPSNNGVGTPDANVFDPGSRSWSAAPSMSDRRWYPTATCLADGRVLVTSGSQFTDFDWVEVPEAYDPATNRWTKLTGASAPIPYYPHVFVLPNGNVIDVSTFEQPIQSDVLDMGTQSRTVVDSQVLDGGSAVMYAPGKFMKSGTAAFNNGSTDPAAATTYVLDMTQPSPGWRQTASMQFPRSYHTLTLLPDGTVLVTGGGRTKDSTDVPNAVYQAELWSPATEAWTTLSAMQRPRLYHSTALLLPDARVLVAGGGRNFRSTMKEFNGEIFSPPYLFKGARPTITGVPASLHYGSDVFVQTPDGPSIGSVALMKPGSVTHGFNQDQRYVPLSFQSAAGGLTVHGPLNANLAPAGYYMLFIVNTAGVPSTAAFVTVGP
jgi:hypothetical protein